MADPDLNIKDVIDAPDSSYCHNVMAGLWADAVATACRACHLPFIDKLPEVAG